MRSEQAQASTISVMHTTTACACLRPHLTASGVLQGVSVPATQSTLIYALLGLVYGSLAAWRSRGNDISWTRYAITHLCAGVCAHRSARCTCQGL